MKRTENGIDHFELRWKSYEIIEKPSPGFVDASFRLQDELKPDENLNDFLLNARKKGHWVIPKYYFNGDDFTWWYNLNIIKKRILDEPGHNFNTIAWIHNTGKNIPWLKFHLARMHGQVFTKQEMSNLGIDLDEKAVAIENETVQIFCCCICADRGCGGFDIIVTADDGLVTWSFPHDYLRDFKFEYHQYSQQFHAYKRFVEQYGFG